MAQKLYQWLQGEKRGQIVSLTGIEPEDGVTYLTFDDGSRCNVDLAAALNDHKAYTDGMFVAEVCDRTNVWTFEDKVVEDDIRWGQLKETGEMVQGWDPYTHGKDGTMNKQRKSTTAIPPKHVVTKEEMTAGADKLKALGITPDTPGYEEGMKSMTIPTQQLLSGNVMGESISNNSGGNYEHLMQGEVYGDKGEYLGKTTIGVDPTGAKPPSMKDLQQYQRATEIYIPKDINESVAVQPQEKTQVSVSKPIASTVDNLMIKRDAMLEASNVEEPKNKVKDSPIYSIVSMCKKKEVSIPLQLDIKIPSKSIYNLIKDDYADEMLDDFFNIILSDIKTDDIKECLKNALKCAYENTPQNS